MEVFGSLRSMGNITIKYRMWVGYLFSLGNGAAKMIPANNPPHKEALPGLESWQAGKIASWHNLEGHPIKWFSVVCIDRRGKSFGNCVLQGLPMLVYEMVMRRLITYDGNACIGQ
ncbi:hypothetical protein J1N35_012276 [Gossypium stocksii]|uniref:Uncharacterized protein n=1 Tax=Gossypium stocksii TaxID=47602 RepID=A0A9D4AE74_9ROSI|nr:hypothetical protein J1N35_012276 [Gossypium stocksii]